MCKFCAKSGKVLKNRVGRKVKKFEVDKTDDLSLFLICDKEVLQMKLNDQEDLNQMEVKVPKKSMIGGNFKKKQVRRMLSRGRSRVLESDDRNSYVKVHANPKNELNFFKFDKEMKYFYTHDDKVIKKYLYETGTLVQSFVGHKEALKSMMFTNDFSYMIR
jgi:hypothetical protein